MLTHFIPYRFIVTFCTSLYSLLCFRLIEIKCPPKWKQLTPRQAALKLSCVEVSGKLSLRPDTAFYRQVQMQMGLYGYTLCDFVVYTKRGIEVVPVEFNQSYFEAMLHTVDTFYASYIFPRLLHSVQQ